MHHDILDDPYRALKLGALILVSSRIYVSRFSDTVLTMRLGCHHRLPFTTHSSAAPVWLWLIVFLTSFLGFVC